MFGLFKRKTVSEGCIPFFGYNLYFSEGTSIVQRFLKDGSYEPDVLNALDAHMPQHGAVIDVGANIGMISLYIAAKRPAVTVYSFEPGPHQLTYLQKNVEANALGNRIHVSGVALSNENGTAKFSVHNSADVSGDGFADTKRAGKTRSIKVRTQQLDDWWKEKGKPDISLIKMDTEGSEMWIMQGGKELIASLKPVLLIEINALNLRVYPYKPLDVFEYIQSIGYILCTLTNEKIDKENFINLLKNQDTFLAFPKQ